jgi:hypothetical protein
MGIVIFPAWAVVIVLAVFVPNEITILCAVLATVATFAFIADD